MLKEKFRLFLSICILAVVMAAGNLSSPSSCSAANFVSEDQCAIGGITYYCSTDYVKSIYGEPTRISGNKWWYGDTFYIAVHDNHVDGIYCTGHNGMATPAGVEVGMDVSVLNDVYGPATSVYRLSADQTHYAYMTKFGMGNTCLAFTVRNNRITKIEVS